MAIFRFYAFARFIQSTRLGDADAARTLVQAALLT